MKVLIAEDEAPARERLLETLARVVPQAVVVGQAASVRELRQWLATHPEPDLLLLDIQLADGLSLELFRDTPLALPTVFTTACGATRASVSSSRSRAGASSSAMSTFTARPPATARPAAAAPRSACRRAPPPMRGR